MKFDKCYCYELYISTNKLIKYCNNYKDKQGLNHINTVI